jgi:translation initiation factor IF-2
LKIRIFTLAKELDLDSKVLIGYCQKVGISIKDSPLASISEEERDRVVAFIREGGGETTAKAEEMVPTRETTRQVSGKVPKIKTLAPRTQPTRKEQEPEPEPVEEPVAAEPEPADSPTAEPAPSVAAEAAPTAEPESEVAAELPAESDDAEDGGTPSEGPVEGAPLRREDYMPAYGTSMRTMVARGTISDTGLRAARKPKAKPGPALPKLAEPPPAPKSPQASAPAAEGPAQKPELRLSRELIAEGRPLHEHLRQHTEEKKKRKGDDFSVEEFSEDTLKRAAGGKGGGVRMAGMGLLSERKQRQARRTKGGRLLTDEEEAQEEAAERRRSQRLRGKRGAVATQVKSSAVIELPISVRGLSEALGRKAPELLGILAKRGELLTINSTLDEDLVLELAMECGVDLQIQREQDIEEQLAEKAATIQEGAELVSRPPIVTILGHVDHGKTTLLDKIRSTDVAAGEVGGITQHIAAYQVEHSGRKITFLDTPGHAAFGEMRARGANVTDIAVLVVAANDGVMPQTVEAINHAKAANVPIVVALNKIDLPERNEQRVLQDLAAQNILASEWGGDTEVVRTSGTTGQGIDDLLETLLTISDLKELQADPNRSANGVCLEAFRDEGRGALAWLIVQDGTLKKGDVILCGSAFGRIRNMYDDHDREVEIAVPAQPVKVTGLDAVPGAGDRFFVTTDLEEARLAATRRRDRGREVQLSQRGKLRTLQEILSSGEAGGVQDLPLIVKADTPGSLEALKGEIGKFQHPEVRVRILHDGVGGVNESDVYLASASNAIIVAFHVVPEDRAATLAEREGVEIRTYGIIYEVTDDIKKALEGLLRPERVEVATGRAIVLQTFDVSRFGKIAGCRVLSGTIERSNRVRLIRDQRVMNEYNILSLRRNKDDVREVRDGLECGIRLEGFDDIKEGDIFQAFKVEEIKRTL